MEKYDIQVVTPATTQPITLAEACRHLQVDLGDDDTRVEATIAAATLQFEADTGMKLMPQSLRQVMPKWPGPRTEVTLMAAPVVAVTSVTYIDEDGTRQSLLNFHDGDRFGLRRLEPFYQEYWPTAWEQIDSIQIEFDAGYANAASVPADIKYALMMLIRAWYDNPEGGRSPGYQRIMERYKLFNYG